MTRQEMIRQAAIAKAKRDKEAAKPVINERTQLVIDYINKFLQDDPAKEKYLALLENKKGR